MQPKVCEIEGILDLTYYSGKDYYSDGQIEDDLLEIVKHYKQNEYDQIILEKQSWPVLYHLSSHRENVVSWMNSFDNAKVLEIGSGCGAITGALARKAKSVTCVELSKKRSMINAYRNAHHKNTKIMVGNYQDIESNLDSDFDVITLIGVFEYSASYIDNENPYIMMLEKAKTHLKKGGKIIIAIENKLGLKYFAGCKEDHTDKYFEGLEGYPTSSGVKTFGKRELEKLISKVGFSETVFYYPYPDYKFATDIYSDFYLPSCQQLQNNTRNYDGERMTLFNEEKVYESILENELFPEFSNSFLVVLER